MLSLRQRCALVLAGAIAGHLFPPSLAAQFQPALMRGTWEQVSSRDLETGAVEEIGKTRLVWLQFTGEVASQVWMSRERAVVQPDELARMTPEDRRKTNYAKVWDNEGRPQFSGLAGFYHLEGSRMYFTLPVYLEPASINGGGVDTVVQADAQTLRYRTGRTADGRYAREQTYRRVDGASSGPRGPRGKFDPRDLLGTWQSVETRNLKTGEVQRVTLERTSWFRLSDSTWTYLTMDKDRPIVTPQELSAMSPADRMAANYAKIWNEAGGNRFWGSAGTYRVKGDTITFVRRVISLEPHMVRVNETSELITRLDREMYITRSAPDANGVVREFVSRRVD
jgi:hypothetical protein